MTREGALGIVAAVAVVLLAGLVWAWRRRARRDADLSAPVGEIPAGAVALSAWPALYVATTRHGEPLERLAIGGLGFRSRSDVTVTDAGVALDVTGRPRVFLAADRIEDVAPATVAIDRVVEAGGLVCLAWRLEAGTVVDSYLRPQDASARALADAVAGILPPTQTGTHA